MITYTTLMGLAAGVAILLAVLLGYKLFYKKTNIISFDGWALAFIGLGGILTVSAGHMSLTWPLESPERYKNFMFGEPVLALGVLVLLAGFFLWRRGDMLVAMLNAKGEQQKRADDYLQSVMRPIMWIVFSLGLALAALTIGAFHYQVFATAPPQEPILGTLPKAVVNTWLSLQYALPALGCLLAPLAFYTRNRLIMAVTGASLFLTGAGWLITAVIVYYTHIAMDFNFRMGM